MPASWGLGSLAWQGWRACACAQVCAPYAALQGYKFRVKLTPGTQRKGRAARQVHGLAASLCLP